LLPQNNSGLVLQGVRKVFSRVVAVDGISFTVPRSSMFGLLGANGAGKTTTLRMVLNVLTPDAGTITWNGQPAVEVPRGTFGYLPEERGLYLKMKVGEELVFLAGLYGIQAREANRRAHEWLGKLGLGDAWNRKVEELSKGNQQKVQVLAAILHEPDLMLLDEPFSGLDPINTEVLRDTLLQRRAQGHTIIFSSHRLEQVEEICDHVAIIHKGRLLMAGSLNDIKRRTSRNMVELAFMSDSDQPLNLDGFLQSLAPYHLTIHERRADSVRLELMDGTTPDQLLQTAIQHGPGDVRRFELVEPSLQEIFISAVQADDPSAVEELVAEGALPGRKVLTEG
jgi:ABC-2 type transport system ATP-binding protein